MDQHRQQLAPKFKAVRAIFEQQFDPSQGITWSEPRGGYYISLHTPPGCARRSIELVSATGITLTPAGAAFPYQNDARDQHIRIAPTSLSLSAVKQAAAGVTAAVNLAVAEQRISRQP